MPSPREIAKQVNNPAGFRPEPDERAPQMPPEGREKDYRANPRITPDGKPPANVK